MHFAQANAKFCYDQSHQYSLDDQERKIHQNHVFCEVLLHWAESQDISDIAVGPKYGWGTWDKIFTET